MMVSVPECKKKLSERKFYLRKVQLLTVASENLFHVRHSKSHLNDISRVAPVLSFPYEILSSSKVFSPLCFQEECLFLVLVIWS